LPVFPIDRSGSWAMPFKKGNKKAEIPGMKETYDKIESLFEKFVNLALKIYGSAITFFIAVIAVIVFVSTKVFYKQNLHDIIRDMITCITFLSFFIIQKAFNKYTAASHLKINELVASHDQASNEVINVEHKTEAELKEMTKNYSRHANSDISDNGEK
jgi:low affinity Fe/Cu permease